MPPARQYLGARASEPRDGGACTPIGSCREARGPRRLISAESGHRVKIVASKSCREVCDNVKHRSLRQFLFAESGFIFNASLIFTYLGNDQAYIWAIAQEGEVKFAIAPLTRKMVEAKITRLRRALDPSVEALGDIPTFDLQSAYELHAAVLAPVHEGWRNAKNLLEVAHGALGQLPFSVLPTKPVALGAKNAPLFA